MSNTATPYLGFLNDTNDSICCCSRPFDIPKHSNMASTPAVPAYRRNGKIPSCEPCRISKLRCDHERPTCRRCRQRQKQCIYHPAPMTKSRSSDGASSPTFRVNTRPPPSASAPARQSLPSGYLPTPEEDQFRPEVCRFDLYHYDLAALLVVGYLLLTLRIIDSNSD